MSTDRACVGLIESLSIYRIETSGPGSKEANISCASVWFPVPSRKPNSTLRRLKTYPAFDNCVKSNQASKQARRRRRRGIYPHTGISKKKVTRPRLFHPHRPVKSGDLRLCSTLLLPAAVSCSALLCFALACLLCSAIPCLRDSFYILQKTLLLCFASLSVRKATARLTFV